MEHAIRSHIRKKLDEDPVYYQGLSVRLEEILEKFGQDWEQLALALADFVEEVQRGRKKDNDLGLDPEVHAPFFDLLKQEREREAPVRGPDVKWLADLTVKLVEGIIRPSVGLVGFWQNASRQEELRGKIFQFLVGDDEVLLGDHDGEEIVTFERADLVADDLVKLAKANHHKLMRES